MKILKLKSILFGLIAVFAVTALLTSCEQETLNNLEEEVTLQEVKIEVPESVEQVAEEDMQLRGGTALYWNYRPKSMSSGSNYMSAKYCIDRPGIVMAQAFNCNWKLIGQDVKNVNQGCGTANLYPKAPGGCAPYTYIQVKLLDRNWNQLRKIQ